MKKTWLSTLVLLSTMTFAATAQARGSGSGVLFDVNLYYGSTKTEETNVGGTPTKTDSSTAIYDIKLGYLSGTGLYLGGIYTSRSNSVLNQAGTNGTATGASVGYMGAQGFFVMGHYLLSATDATYKEGSGLQVDVGYKAGMGGGWLVGGELSYRSITYKKDDNNASLESYKSDEIIPMVSIGYIF